MTILDPFVWATNLQTGVAAPVPRNLISIDPALYRVDKNHPVRDGLDQLLSAKQPAPIPTAVPDKKDK